MTTEFCRRGEECKEDMEKDCEWKKLKLYERENAQRERDRREKNAKNRGTESHRESICDHSSSAYLLARDEQEEERQKELLYQLLGPVFFGKKEAENRKELIELFRVRYGIDVEHDFYEGDEHYEEYLEAQQAIAEGMSIYGGDILFEDNALAEYAERLWERMEKSENVRFRRINTMLEE